MVSTDENPSRALTIERERESEEEQDQIEKVQEGEEMGERDDDGS